MSKDAVATMGAVLPDDAGGRDAVHVAVFSAIATKETLLPGQRVAISGGQSGGHDTTVCSAGDHVAIVDPFLVEPVCPGQRFWAYLYPRTITALSHRWSHPAFEDSDEVYGTPAARLRAREWMQDWLDHTGQCSLSAVMEALDRHLVHGDDGKILCIYGESASGDIPTEFWEHAEVLLGRKIKGPKPAYFSCSC